MVLAFVCWSITALLHAQVGLQAPCTSVPGQNQAAVEPDAAACLPQDICQADTTEELAADTLAIDTAALAAVTDSLLRIAKPESRLSHFQPDPIRAMWLALVVPGGGQIYNRKYWKLPIIYGGYLGCAYALTWNNQMLKDYSQAYLDIMDSDPNTKSYEKMLPLGYDITGKEERFKEIFKNKKNHFRRFRDMSIFAFAGVYLLSVVDAYVDAELSSFDISSDLSMHLEPSMMKTYMVGGRGVRQVPALSVCLNF